MPTPPETLAVYTALSDQPMTLRAVAERFFNDDVIAARRTLRALEDDDLIEADPIHRAILDGAPKSVRVWRVKDPK